MLDARVVSNIFVELAQKDDNTLTPLQILKLVYIAHGWSLGMRRRPLISNRVEAWKYGPVIPDLYHYIKQYRDKPVQIIDLEKIDDINDFKTPKGDDMVLIEGVYNSYRKFDGLELSAMTHRKGTPWADSFRPRELDVPISDDITQHYYKKLYEEIRTELFYMDFD